MQYSVSFYVKFVIGIILCIYTSTKASSDIIMRGEQNQKGIEKRKLTQSIDSDSRKIIIIDTFETAVVAYCKNDTMKVDKISLKSEKSKNIWSTYVPEKCFQGKESDLQLYFNSETKYLYVGFTLLENKRLYNDSMLTLKRSANKYYNRYFFYFNLNAANDSLLWIKDTIVLSSLLKGKEQQDDGESVRGKLVYIENTESNTDLQGKVWDRVWYGFFVVNWLNVPEEKCINTENCYTYTLYAKGKKERITAEGFLGYFNNIERVVHVIE